MNAQAIMPDIVLAAIAAVLVEFLRRRHRRKVDERKCWRIVVEYEKK
jgi:hypothetical protein